MNYRVAALLLSASIVVGPAISQTTRLVPGQYPTIQAAINACVNGDTVLVSPGTYSGTVSFNGKTITLTSSGGASSTTLTAAAASIVVTFAGGEGTACVLTGFTIANAGGGILCQNASPQIINCVISGHTKAFNASGGGIRCTASGASVCSPAISGCSILNNVAGYGGGLAFEGSAAVSSSPVLTNCVIAGNFSTASSQFGGGGVYLNGTTVSASFIGCRFHDNTSWNGGGAMLIGTLASLSMTRCQVDHNSGPNAAIGGYLLQATLTGCLITDNVGHGAPLFFGNPTGNPPTATATLQCCTVAGNFDTNGYGQIGGFVVQGGPINVTVANSIIWGNNGANVYFIGSGVTSSVTYSDVGVGAFSGASNISANPLFVDAAHGDYHLASQSPCVNAGNPGGTGLPSTDIDGSPRVAGGVVDMGADEVPLLAMPGTADGLDLYVLVNGAGDPLASTRAAAAGNLITAHMRSATGSLVGGLPLFAARLYFTGNPFPVAGNGIWMDGQSLIVYGTLSAPPFSFPGLSADGLDFAFTVPAGLTGNSVRFQGLVTTVNALNGMWATSNATEVTF